MATTPEIRVAALRADKAATAGLTVDATVVNEDLALVARAKGGDQSAFSALVRAYQERAVRVACSFLGNFEDARDVAQEAFAKAFRNLDSFKGDSRFYTWFYRILVNACKDHLRKRKLRSWFGARSQSDADLIDLIPARGEGPGAMARNAELGREIVAAMQRLPFGQRTAFSLRYLEGMTLEEIGEAMGVTVGAVKAHLWQACAKMRGFLKTTLGGES